MVPGRLVEFASGHVLYRMSDGTRTVPIREVCAMATFSYVVAAAVPPERVLAALTDFSDRRPDLWPTLARHYYKVLQVGPTSADVTEGSSVFGGIWGREHYDWSTPGVVTATLVESTIAEPGGTWTFTVRSDGQGGSVTTGEMRRKSKGLKGRLVGALAQITGPQLFASNLKKTLAIVAATPDAKPV
jgi:polyketide cyclase/dehydrase/lipid transport protein